MPDTLKAGDDVTHLMDTYQAGEDVTHLFDQPTPRSPGASGSWEPEPEKSWLSSVGDFTKEALASLNPVTLAKGAVATANNPIGAVDSILQAQGRLGQEAEEAFKAGDYTTGTRKLIHYLVPLLGTGLDRSSDLLSQGETAKGLGAAVDVAGQIALPAALSKVSSVRIPTPFKNPNPVAAEAVQFAQDQGIPVRAGVATGNNAVQGAEWLADRSLAGSTIASKMGQREAGALTRVGNELAGRVSNVSPSAEQAGAGINTSLEDLMSSFHEEATKHYDAVRAAEANPANATTVTTQQQSKILSPTGKPVNVQVHTQVPLMVDLSSTKAALKPIYDRLQRQYGVTITEVSPGFKALQNIVEGPDFGPLSQVDMDLGTLKGIARSDLPELRSISQGIAAKSVRELSDAVLDAAAKAGPRVIDSLERGREATKSKYEARAIWNQIKDEPVKAYNQMVLPKDGGIELLGEVNRLAPTEIPKVARAYLDDLLQQATVDGAFGKRGTIATKWENLGPETKKILFKDPEYISDLNNFFKYAKMSGMSPNPSGSGHIVSLLGQGTLIFTNPQIGIPLQALGATASAILRSPYGVKLLTKGMKVPVGNKAAGAAILSELTKIAGGDLNLQPIEAKP